MHKRGLHHLPYSLLRLSSYVGLLATRLGNRLLPDHTWPGRIYEVEYCYLPRKIERVKFIFCISDFCRRHRMKYCDPAHWDKMHIVRLGFDTEEFKPVSRDAKVPLETGLYWSPGAGQGTAYSPQSVFSLHSKGHVLHRCPFEDMISRPSHRLLRCDPDIACAPLPARRPDPPDFRGAWPAPDVVASLPPATAVAFGRACGARRSAPPRLRRSAAPGNGL
jgi:hypothetical protein